MFTQRKLEILYVANSGVMISSKDKKILIDGIHTEDIPPYFSVPKKYIDKIILKKEPFDNLDILFYTHHHADHFHPAATLETMHRNPLLQMIGTPAVLDQLSSTTAYLDDFASQLKPLSLPLYKSLSMNLKGIAFEITSLSHDGDTYQGIENYSYLIELKNKLILHVGDAQPTIFNFQNAGLYGRRVDILIVPFPFIGLVAGRKIIKSMEPQVVLVTHLPDKAQDEGNWLFNSYNAYLKHKTQLPKQTTFFIKPGQSVII
ncbi:MAG: MBL fold metallo-hydrolase [Eubacteriaceae bacterium]|nr:MBL fold metallo-hydrolase [Eubacteriaceae bacterium]